MRKYLIWLFVFAILEIGMALYLTAWRNYFWDAVSLKHSQEFIKQLAIFTGVAVMICFVSGFSGYLASLTAIKWREKLNGKAFDMYGIDIIMKKKPIENLSQRLQEDCMSYPDLVIQLGIGTSKAVLYLLVFSVSLIYYFSWMYLGILVVYCVVGTFITHYIAKPLIHLNYEQQRAEASYRNNLSLDNFQDCVRIMLGLAKKQKHLTYFQQFYLQVGVVIPLIAIAPEYFNSAMTLGLLMRFNSLASTITDNLSYGISSFGMINRLLSCRKRLLEAKIL